MTERTLFNTIVDHEYMVPDDTLASGQATSDHSNDDVLDFKGLCDRCMGNLDLLQRVLDKFDKRIPEELVELERVLELEDAAKIALVAHRIKGNSSNVSATGLWKAAGEIEDLGRAGRVADIHAHVKDLREHWRRYVDRRGSQRSRAAGSSKSDQPSGSRGDRP
jgi:HPt (histidine-containing phosphotransfer) domain-containing protein